MGIRQTIHEWAKALVWSVVIIKVVNFLFFQLCIVPTGSMIPSVFPGDIVFISKLHYGAKTPQTPLHIPFTQEKIPLTKIRSYLTWIQLPSYSLPGFSTPARGDCVVIWPPKSAGGANIPADVKVPFLKRIIGMPGDKFSIVDGNEQVNGERLGAFSDYQYSYKIDTDQMLPDSFFSNNKITHYQHLLEGGAYVHTTEANAQRLRQIPAINDVVRVIKELGAPEAAVFSTLLGGNKDQLPEFIIPAKGLEIAINKNTLSLYEEVIRYYEGNKKVEVVNNELWIGGRRMEKYRFEQNYYIVMGDNRDSSYDSRYFGFVPEKYIQGKAIYILASGKNSGRSALFNLITFNMRMSRFLKMLK